MVVLIQTSVQVIRLVLLVNLDMCIVQHTYTYMVSFIQQCISLVEDNSDQLNLFNYNASNNEIITTKKCKVEQNDNIKCSSCNLNVPKFVQC